MIIIGADYHPGFQQIAVMDTETGELNELRLEHREEAEQFYHALAAQGLKVRVGMEASGHARWFERLLAELHFELWIGDAAEIRTKRVRKQKTDRQDAQLLLRLLLEDRFPRVWVASYENRDLRQLLWHRHRMVQTRYFRAKIAQERLIKESSIPYSIVHATQFFEFLKGLADISFDGDKVHLPPVLFQPMAADDVASGVGRIAVGPPGNGIVEIGGPEQFRLDELVRRRLATLKDPREVIADPRARYSGAEVGERTLVPGKDARLGETRFETWLTRPAAKAAGR